MKIILFSILSSIFETYIMFFGDIFETRFKIFLFLSDRIPSKTVRTVDSTSRTVNFTRSWNYFFKRLYDDTVLLYYCTVPKWELRHFIQSQRTKCIELMRMKFSRFRFFWWWFQDTIHNNMQYRYFFMRILVSRFKIFNVNMQNLTVNFKKNCMLPNTKFRVYRIRIIVYGTVP